MAGYRTLISLGDFEVRLTGWRNAYVAFCRSEAGRWEQVASVGSRSALMSALVVADVSDAVLATCGRLPELPRDVPAGRGSLPAGEAREAWSSIAVAGELRQVRVPKRGVRYRVYARASAWAEWERILSAASRSVLLRRVRALGVPEDFIRACEALPELPADWEPEPRLRGEGVVSDKGEGGP